MLIQMAEVTKKFMISKINISWQLTRLTLR
jgi:hypothetical protein